MKKYIVTIQIEKECIVSAKSYEDAEDQVIKLNNNADDIVNVIDIREIEKS